MLLYKTNTAESLKDYVTSKTNDQQFSSTYPHNEINIIFMPLVIFTFVLLKAQFRNSTRFA